MTDKWRCGTDTHAPQQSSSTSDPNTACRASQLRDHEICHLGASEAAGMLLPVVSGGQTTWSVELPEALYLIRARTGVPSLTWAV